MWVREIEVNAGGKTFTNLGQDAIDIEFEIPFSDKEEPDVSEVILYNLSDSSINQITADKYVYVNAGYKNLGNKGNILTGHIEEVKTEWDNVTKITTILASDGGRNWRGTKLNRSYTAGIKASEIMRDLANVMGYEIVAIEPVIDKVYPRGYVISGSASTNLKNLVKDTQSKMFINKNRLVIRAKDIGKNIGFTLDASSGLIGSPTKEVEEVEEKTNNGKGKAKKKKKTRWRVTSLLNPLLETDGIIRVNSKVLTGEFRIIEGTHTKEFNTELLVEEV